MALQIILENLEGLDDSIKALYRQDDNGKYRLDVDGIEDTGGLKSALEKERIAKREAERQRKALEEKYHGIDLEQYKVIMDKFSTDEETGLLKAGKIDEVFDKRTERMRAEHEKTLKQLSEERDSALKRAAAYESKVFENCIRESAGKSNVIPTAVEDVILRARGAFVLAEDGGLKAVDTNGEQVYGKDGKTGLTVQEWIETLKENAPHFFPSVSGAGIKGGGKGASLNPWLKETWNLTEQGKIYKENPVKAADLAAQAGVKI